MSLSVAKLIAPQTKEHQLSVKEDAYEAIFVEIKAVIGEMDGYGPHDRAKVLQSLAIAYRYASGGAQPGSVTVEK